MLWDELDDLAGFVLALMFMRLTRAGEPRQVIQRQV